MKISALVFLLVGSAAAFSPQKPVSIEEGVKKAFASFALASTVLTNFAAVPAEAYYTGSDALDSSSQVLLAARSGGRAGGRSSSAPSRAARAPPTTRVIERQTTVIQQPSYGGGVAVMAPPPMYMAPPAPSGLGLALGINAVSGIAEGFREARQENEIRSTRDQLTEARIKEAEMEARLRMLESQMAR